jgi:serine/threonine-protein kinase
VTFRSADLHFEDFTASTPATLGPYRVLHPIGSGVLGPVFRGIDRDADRLLALKVFRLDLAPDALARFAHGLRQLAARGRPDAALVMPLDAGHDHGWPFVALPLVAGESLDARLRHRSAMPLGEVVRLLDPLVRALDRATDQGLIHGALHPRDIIVRAEPFEVHLTGVGIAPLLEPLGVRPPMRRPYAPPERVAGQAISSRTDVYSVAVIAHELLTGQHFAAASDDWLLADVPAGRRPALREVFARALAEDPERRYATTSAFLAALAGNAEAAAARPATTRAAVAPASTVVVSPPAESTVHPNPAPPAPQARPSASGASGARSGASPSRDVLLRLQAESSVPPQAKSARPARLWAAALSIVIVGLAVGVVVGGAIGQHWFFGEVLPIGPAALVSGTDVTMGGAGVSAPPAAADPSSSTVPAPAVERIAAPAIGLLVRSSPPGALVTIDGRLYGETPVAVRDLPAGEYQVRVARPGYAPRTERVRLTGTRPQTLAVALQKGLDLTRPYGVLDVDSRPRGARVTVDGRYLGQTPLRWPEAVPGLRTVEVALPGYATVTSRVTVTPGEPAKLTLTLNERR